MSLTIKKKPSKAELKSISSPIKQEMKQFKKTYKSAMQTDVFLINRISGYLTAKYGKMIRPRLVLLSGRAFGEVNDKTIASAALVELLHIATLIHDDVVDRSDTRRGIPSIQALWKNKASVLMGDFLFSRALINLISLEDFSSLSILSNAAERMSKGELLQMEKNRSNGMDEETYFRMIGDKTASLISACCALGAQTTAKSEKEVAALAKYGEHLGIAFQIKDDLFDFDGKKKFLGKPVGKDVKENLMTLPVIHALGNSGRRKGRELVKILKNKNGKKDFQRVVDFVTDNGGVKYAEDQLKKQGDLAINEIDFLPEGSVKTSLIDFVKYNALRNR